ncbi:TOTE conflict system archaeo-eukaryotic primase domain-containing protein [Verrucomicrobiota bacterium sgz303538]
MSADRIAQIEAELQNIDRKRHDLLVELDALRREMTAEPLLPLRIAVPRTAQEKISFFLSLFGARRSVFPQLWINQKTGQKGYSPVCHNEWVRGVCEKPRVKCSECLHQAFAALDSQAVEDHLTGRRTVGTYAIREDNSCIFLAADFDGSGWQQDVNAYWQAALEFGVQAAVERSRSGEGAHVWIFFAQAVPAELARRLGTMIVAKASARHAGLKLSTYDRFFPNQDSIPAAGFGNLIALPLQKVPRANGNTLFLDEDLNPYADQWQYLASVPRVTLGELEKIVESVRPANAGKDDNDEADTVALRCDDGALDLIPQTVTKGVFQGVLEIVLDAQVSVATPALPACLVASLKRLGTLPNPAFYEKQRLRFPTYNIPRFIFCGEVHDSRLVLPRGTLAGVLELARKAGGKAKVLDKRTHASPAAFSLRGKLSEIQQSAVDSMLPHDGAVLVAPPGAGKTVMGCAIIAARNVPTLILVHRKPLMEQWRERCMEFLGVEKKEIHILGQARNRESSLAIGMLQTLARSDSPREMLVGYAQVIIDECHHVPAASFEAVMKQCPSRFIVGLTATPTRKDGLQKILFLQCGSIRHRIEIDRGVGLNRRVIVRELSLRVPPEESRMPIHKLWEMLATSEARNRQIAKDILYSVAQQRCAAVLSDRKEHLLTLECLLHQGLANAGDRVFRIDGSMAQKERATVLRKLEQMGAERQPFVILATSSLLGEGFDLPVLDTLFLTMPVSFKGRIIQYAGRLHRTAEGKEDALIYDYVEADHPLMAHMHRKRMAALRQLGYQIERDLLSVEISGVEGAP